MGLEVPVRIPEDAFIPEATQFGVSVPYVKQIWREGTL
jgi:hypothetical protein